MKKEILEKIIKESRTYTETIKKLGLRAAGGNFKTLKNNIENLSGEEQTMLKNQQMLIKADHDKVKSLHNKLLVHS